MSKDNKIHMPGAFGGLMRYDDEYNSKFMISPALVIGVIIAIIVFALILRLFFPIDLPLPTG
jgi:preprotein translocase subunit Sec61beta